MDISSVKTKSLGGWKFWLLIIKDSTDMCWSYFLKEKSEMLAPLSSANARIVENFLHIADRLSLLSTRERLRLLDYIVERVHCELCYGVVLIDCFFIQTYDYSFCSTGLYTRNKSNCEEYCNESR